MKDMERQKFEKDFKDAFENAGISPSDTLWTNIELDIEKSSSEKMKRSLLIYKLMAAASIAFAMCFGGAYYFSAKTQNDLQSQLQSYRDAEDSRGKDLKYADNNTKQTSDKSGVIGQTNNAGVEEESVTNGSVREVAAKQVINLALTNNDKENGLGDDRGGLNSLPGNERIRSTGTTTIATTYSSGTKANVTELVKEDLLFASDANDGVDNKISTNNNPSNRLAANTTNQNIKSTVNETTSITYASDANHEKEQVVATLRERHITTLLQSPRPALVLPVAEVVDPVAVMMAKLQQRERELSEEGDVKENKPKRTGKENLWTSVGFAAGSFNSNVHSSSNNVATTTANGFAASNTAADNQNSASGTAYSVGLSMGTKVTERWIIQGGVNYLTQNSSYQANGVVSSSDFSSFRAASISELKAAGTNAQADKYVSTAPYNINNNLQFVSIPLQAGYLAVNRKIGLQVNAGVSTDLFLQNTIAPQGGGLEKTTQGRGDDSPYRPVNFSGLFGSELSYKFGTRYRLAINPGLRYPINSIYKSEVGVSSNPITMDIGVRFRYIFR